jgi:hypothetical protein
VRERRPDLRHVLSNRYFSTPNSRVASSRGVVDSLSRLRDGSSRVQNSLVCIMTLQWMIVTRVRQLVLCTVKDFTALHLIPTFTVLYKRSLMYLIC